MSTSATELQVEPGPVAIRIRYNGGMWRSHNVSEQFLLKFAAFLRSHPKLDVEWERVAS